VTDPVEAVKVAFVVFAGFYVVCLATTWFFYTRRVTVAGRAPALATANV
jgi:nitrate/nitrite transporter NarK